ncbi:uncharacterized protein [Rutidosis leptorrhynchoides]|uniref:uncharacterized protein n=1 Tax=Rutidosis leptorrhynchoides TaxID=125765 RepID=UPI003A98ED34
MQFYKNITISTRKEIDTAAGGATLSKTPEELQQLISDLAIQSHDWYQANSNQQEIKAEVKNEVTTLQDNIEMLEMELKELKEKSILGNVSRVSQEETIKNPRGNQEIQAITTRSGKTTQDPVMPSQEENHELLNETSTPVKKDEPPKINKPLEPVPYPQQLRKEKQQKSLEDFANMFNKINVNIPLIDLLKENLHFGKCLQTLLSNKGKDAEKSSRFIIKECKAIFQKYDIPEKLGEPGSITVPCSFNNSRIYQALADTGASINLMPYSLYKRLGLEELTPTKMSIYLADSSFNYPMGIAENIPVKIDRFTFFADLVILEMKENDKIPIILGRPFLRTAAFELQMQTNTYSLGIADDRITLNNHLELDLACPTIKYVETCIKEEFDEFLLMDIDEFVSEIIEENLDEGFEELMKDEMNELIEKENEPITDELRIKHSLEVPSKLELKELPSHIEYVFLKDNSELPVIISSELSKDQKEQLLEVLKNIEKLSLGKPLIFQELTPPSVLIKFY